jgi:hypothetical protein
MSKGRDAEALLLFEHLAAIGSREEAILLPLVKLLAHKGVPFRPSKSSSS